MLESIKVQEKFENWAKDFDLNNPIRLDKKLVHKVNEQNVFISRVEQINKGDTDNFIAQVAVDVTHPYIFEHPYDHVPGMLILESGRQVSVAIAHLFYNVDFNTVFILEEMYARFNKYIEISKPLFIISTMKKKIYRKGVLCQMEHDGNFVQDNDKVGYMAGSWKMFDKKIIQRMRRTCN